MERRFEDRRDAGRQLGERLSAYVGRGEALVLALPRGGVPVGLEVARVLEAPLDILLVRKLGVPGQEELALGAIASGGVRVLNESVVRSLGLTEETVARVAAQEKIELDRRESVYRDGAPAPLVRDRVVVLVDDGIATGSTIQAAIQVLREQDPRRIVVGVPVAPAEVCDELAREVDEVHCLLRPTDFYSIGAWYRSFSQLKDAEVRAALEASRE